MQEVTLIQKKVFQGTSQYQVCKEGIHLLRSLKNKKLRIIFNITHERRSLNNFNNMLFGMENKALESEVKDNICLTITKYGKELQGDRVVIILNAYEDVKSEPFMVLMGYLATSVFVYHHKQSLSQHSRLTVLLSKLKNLLLSTNVQNLTKEMTYKKGYSKNPHFLCLLPQQYSGAQNDALKQFYRYSQNGSNILNDAVDVLIDFLPQRSSLSATSKEEIIKIGKQFEQNVLGRQIFNFQFTGSTIENLCFQCCEAFNNSHQLNLNKIYCKIIDNQKSRLEDEAYQQYLKKISQSFFGGGKIDLQECSNFPINNFNLLQKHNEIVQCIMQQTLQCASNCMDLIEYKNLYYSLKEQFKKMFYQLSNANQHKIQQCCRQCFQLLENIQECQINSQTADDLFREINNKFEQFTNGCCQTLGTDLSLLTFTKYQNRLKETIISKVSERIVQALQNYQIGLQEYRAERQQLKYDYRVLGNQLRELQYNYGLQSDILNQYKLKLTAYEPPQPKTHQMYSLELNKSRKKNQELQEQIKDKNLFIQELEGIIVRFQGLAQREKQKYKFSKEIVEMIKEVSNQVNSCHIFIKEAKKTNQLSQEIKQAFLKQRQNIVEQRKNNIHQLSKKEAQFQKLIKEKNLLQEVVNEARQSINVYKQVQETFKDSISNLENTYTQAQCLLAQAQNQLQLFKKAMSLISEQQKGNKSQALNKFYKVTMNKDLKQLLKPFLKK